MLTIHPTSQFRRDHRLAKKRELDLQELRAVIEILAAGKPLEEKYHDHALEGNYEGFRECHIHPDWLLIYTVEKDRQLLVLARTGSHEDLFRE